jgi:Tol biopolymer transport system component
VSGVEAEVSGLTAELVTARRVALAALAGVLASSCVAGAAGLPAPPRIPPAPRPTLHGLIAYSTRGGDIWVMRADGSHRRRLTRSGRDIDFDPDFSPNGRSIVFRSSRGRYAPDRYGIGLEAIRVVDVRTRRDREIQPYTGGLFPAWSPDGAAIAFSGFHPGGRPVDTIQLMRPDGSGLVDLGMPGEVATWSPDGRTIAFASHPGNGNWAVWTMRRDGSDRRQLTHPVLRPPAGAHGDAPAEWSPDGSRILYSAEARGDRELFVMNADGSGKRRVIHWRGGDSPNGWLPDGRIVFAHYRGSEPLPHWYLIRPDGRGLRSLPRLYGAGDPIDWLVRG